MLLNRIYILSPKALGEEAEVDGTIVERKLRPLRDPLPSLKLHQRGMRVASL